ncbi:G-protein coupled receptor dmsr-1-like [Saccostrea cucullata]|uniref:G-protein coupled receptor dmsr-1-like n=1 Tax=Saccostrea cuccullata TaxID=36930 RepID=UPI002ECFD9DA
MLHDIMNTSDLMTLGLSTPSTTTEITNILQFNRNYMKYHGYISSIICIFGVMSNIVNIIVLTRRHMVTPTNCILTALAITDMATMSIYFVYAVYFYIITQPLDSYEHSKGWMYFVVVNNLAVITFHNMAMWLTVSLAVFRYIFVCHHVVANQWCSLDRAKLTIFIIVVVSILVCVPNYFLYQVKDLQDFYTEASNRTNNATANWKGYWIEKSEFIQQNPLYQPITFWIYGVIIKIAPCILLTILSTLIIMTMHQASVRRKRLLSQSNSRHNEEMSAEHNRTTMMLVMVVLFFVVTEFPQGILAGISGLNDTFFNQVYSNLGDVMDLLVLINSAINFLLYCIMSQQFRDTFKNLFLCSFVRNFNNGSITLKNGIHTNHYSSVKTEVTQV